jgi:hypothetical protein
VGKDGAGERWARGGLIAFFNIHIPHVKHGTWKIK